MKITKKNTTSMRQGLLAFAAFVFIGFGIASCGDTPGGGDPDDPNKNNNNNGTTDGKKEYAVTIKNGGAGSSASPSKAVKDTKVTLKPGTIDGFGFNGWTIVKPAGLTIGKDNTFTMSEGAVEVTAAWEAGAYDITVNQGDGSGSSAAKHSAKLNDPITLTPGSRTGYDFDGWTVVKPAAGLTFTSDNTFTMPDEVVEVTAKWKAIDYAITVNQDEGDGAGAGSEASKNSANVGNTITLTAGTYKDGYEFNTWKVIEPQGLTITGNTFTMPAAAVEVTATWKLIDYDITIDQNSGEGAKASKTQANVGDDITLTAGNREGYEFDTWEVVSPGNLTISGNSFKMPASEVKVKATWTAIDYDITVNQNGGTDSAASKPKANVGDIITLTRGTYAGYRFNSWVISPDTVTIADN
ncbi:MAG: InlB B-repeat-containing protein, partial [Treponema sp.]|nr:InlB B-repeat-containing protein [Treponema sp.]